MKILVFDHSAVVDLYRERERILKNKYNYDIEMVIPYYWKEGSRNIKANIKDCFNIYLSSTFLTNNVPLFTYNPFMVIKSLIKSKPDIIDIHEEPYSLSCFQIMLLKFIFSRKSKVVFCSFQNILKKYPFPFNFFEKIIYKYSASAYTCSAEITSVLRRKGYKKRIFEIPLGINEKLFKPGLNVYELRKKYDLDDFTIGFIGRIEQQKGILDLIYALKLMKSNKWKCMIVGDGMAVYDVKKEAGEYLQRDKIIFTGSVQPNQIPYYLNAMDLLVIPSRTTKNWKEQFGRVIAEAMACGVPIIGSNSGAIPEVVGDAGMIFREGDIGELKQCITTVMENQDYYKILKQNALKRSKLFSWDNIANQFDSLYSCVMRDDAHESCD